MHESESFLVWTLSDVKNYFRKQFLHKVLYKYHSKKNWSVLSYKMALKKMDFPFFLKMWFGHGRVTFLAKKILKKPHPKICISFGGSLPIAQIKRCHINPSLPQWIVGLLQWQIGFKSPNFNLKSERLLVLFVSSKMAQGSLGLPVLASKSVISVP